MVESAPKTVVYTNHRAALGIAKQTSITTLSTAKTNLRVVRASDYIQRFQNIEIRHKPSAKHIVPDALSRLQQKDAVRDFSEGELDVLWAHTYEVYALMEMSAQFKQELLQGYQNDDFWAKISHILDYNAETGEDAADLPFSKGGDGLIWRTDNLATDRAHTPERLCVPSSCVKASLF